jgi:hypothetical protein
VPLVGFFFNVLSKPQSLTLEEIFFFDFDVEISEGLMLVELIFLLLNLILFDKQEIS